MAKKKTPVEVEETVVAPVEVPTVCPNCQNSGMFCAVCSNREVTE
jgi:hypothetical protein